jgi:hypothetical protein
LRRGRAIAGVLLVVAALLRLAGLTKDLWLDEVWALRVATELSSPWGAFTLHHEINHHLNTIWLNLVGPNGSAALYHMPSYVLGIVTVAIAGAIGFRRGTAAGIATTAAFALSYELVLYSTEARGYSSVACWTMLAFFALEPIVMGESGRWRVLYWIACALGILSHPIFAGFLGAAVLWSAWSTYRREGTGVSVVRELLRTHAVPVAVLALLWLIDLRLVVAGGGTPANSLIGVYGSALAWAVAAGRAQAVELIACVLVVSMIASAIRATRDVDSPLALFFVGAIAVFPIILILIRGSDLVYTRHFMIAGLLTLLLFGLTLGRWWAEGRRRTVAAAWVAFVIVNLFNIATLATNGRGQYRAAIEYMAASTGGDNVTIGGDHDFRIGMEMWYYLSRAQTTKRVQYFEQGSWPAGGPEWIVVHRESWVTQTPESQIELGPGLRYTIAKAFPTAPLSGLSWYVYHHSAGP